MRRIEGDRADRTELGLKRNSEEPAASPRVDRARSPDLPIKNTPKTDEDRIMTALQYLLSQAEHCRRVALDTSDPFIAEEMQRLASDFEQRARAGGQARRELPFPVSRPIDVQIAAQ